jgi:hypothetical protein
LELAPLRIGAILGATSATRERDMDDARHRLPAEFDRLQTPSSAYAPRQVVTYLCTREHVLSVPFAADAEVPEVWDCRCGQPATRVAAADAF